MNFVYQLTDGSVVHPECREKYQSNRPKGSHYVAIDKAIHADLHTGELPPAGMFKSGRFELCAYCNGPVLEYLQHGFVALPKVSA